MTHAIILHMLKTKGKVKEPCLIGKTFAYAALSCFLNPPIKTAVRSCVCFFLLCLIGCSQWQLLDLVLCSQGALQNMEQPPQKYLSRGSSHLLIFQSLPLTLVTLLIYKVWLSKPLLLRAKCQSPTRPLFSISPLHLLPSLSCISHAHLNFCPNVVLIFTYNISILPTSFLWCLTYLKLSISTWHKVILESWLLPRLKKKRNGVGGLEYISRLLK